MFDEKPRLNYQHEIEGTWGEFATPTGRVAFLMTKARLGTGVRDGLIDSEWRLTSQLRPVREVLETKTLDFGQLLQRDLDDHRVATMLLPYLLEPRRTGPAFFPPILAAVLPFEGNTPIDSYPTPTSSGPNPDDGLRFLDETFGAAIRVRRLATDDGQPHRIRLGRVGWNEELAKLVVIDGQHRAMALIAIDRTLNNSWDKSSGARYRHFYEHRVKDLINAAKEDGKPIQLEKIEIPVLVCWFPEQYGPGRNAQKAARKLFVDVNKEARAPSEARLVLLSDTELVNIFTRSLLNRLREDAPPMPLFSIEYDNPDKDAARPVRWSVLTNLNFLKTAVAFTVFGPEKYIQNVRMSFVGRRSWDDMNAYMRDRLDIQNLFPEQVQDDDRIVLKSEIGNTVFPLSGLPRLVERFMGSWGSAILTILGDLRPYAAHNEALEELYEEWLTNDAIDSLARDAMFEGVGMFWTLRQSYNHWLDTARTTGSGQTSELSKPDIVKAWEVIAKKADHFRGRRAIKYLGKATDSDLAAAAGIYDVVNTHACQLGAILAFATLAAKTGVDHVRVPTFAKDITAAWNAALTVRFAPNKDRRLVLARGIKNSINRIGKMDTPLAVYFRYFWLELLRTPEANKLIGGAVSDLMLADLTSAARTLYLEYLVDEQCKALKKTHPGWSNEKRRQHAFRSESEELGKALSRWFGMSDAAFTSWSAGAKAEVLAAAPVPDAEPDVEGSGSEAEPALPGAAETSSPSGETDDIPEDE